jgi:hypothetical protein
MEMGQIDRYDPQPPLGLDEARPGTQYVPIPTIYFQLLFLVWDCLQSEGQGQGNTRNIHCSCSPDFYHIFQFSIAMRTYVFFNADRMAWIRIFLPRYLVKPFMYLNFDVKSCMLEIEVFVLQSQKFLSGTLI